MTEAWSAGWTASVLAHSAAAPVVSDLRLYWDPSLALASGPVVTLRPVRSEPGADGWDVSLRLAPGLAYIDDRRDGASTVANLSGELRLEFAGDRLQGSMDLFYAQSRLEGYRTYGTRFSVSTSSFLSRDARR